MTPPEIRLWLRLKGEPCGVKFRRQHPISVFIVDFCALQAALIVEVDGADHDRPEQVGYDDWRDGVLRSGGFEIMRVSAAAVMGDADDVAERVVATALLRLAARAVNPA